MPAKPDERQIQDRRRRTVAAGPVGRQASANTDIKLNAEILSYSAAKGFCRGQRGWRVVQADKSGDRAMYGDNVTRGKSCMAELRFPRRHGDCYTNLPSTPHPLKSAGRSESLCCERRRCEGAGGSNLGRPAPVLVARMRVCR